MHEFVQNRRFQAEISTFCHFRFGRTTVCYFRKGYTPLNSFRQSARVLTKQRCHLEISTFCQFSTGHTNFSRFSAKCTGLSKTAFSARDQRVLSFSHWVHYFLAIFNKLGEIVPNSEFSPRSAYFVISALGKAFFSQSERVFSF